MIWKLPVAHRVRTFTWLIHKRRILTNEERHRRGFTLDARCALCNAPTEDLVHVFRDCPLAAAVWRIALPPDMLLDFLRMDPISWLGTILTKSTMHPSWKAGLCITFWKLWQIRNLRLFEHQSFSVDTILLDIAALARQTEKSFTLFGTFCK